jgi:hypothetical protein
MWRSISDGYAAGDASVRSQGNFLTTWAHRHGCNIQALQHITARPSKITGIARAALILTQYEHGYIKWRPPISLRSPHRAGSFDAAGCFRSSVAGTPGLDQFATD